MAVMMKKLLALLLFATSLAAQPSPAIRNRIDSLVAAFNGTSEEFENYARENFTAEALARGDAAKRKALTERIRADFGKLSVRDVERNSDSRLDIGIEGSNGERGAIILDIEAAAPHRITGMGFRIGEREEKGPKLPPAPGDVKELDAYLAKLVAEGRFSGTVVVAKNGKSIFEKAYGLADRGKNIANTPATRHNIGSINKQFTKVAIDQLAAAGKLSLDDPLGEYLPGHANADARKATIRQLLDHTAGLGDFFGADFDKADKSRFRTNSDYYAFVAPRPLAFPPGTGKRYCNACYITLGEIITRVTGMPYERYVEQNVFKPAGMNDSGFFLTDRPAPRMAIGYMATPDGLESNVPTRGAGGSAAGSAFATAEDLLAFDNALRAGKLNGKRTSEALGYAGGSGGINASVESDGTWTVITLANIDPPAAEALSSAISKALSKHD
jgi:CubicO group peptidase (beta-lactamase class C family)